MPNDSFDLPDGLHEVLLRLASEATEADESAVLQADLQYSEDALQIKVAENAVLKADIKALKDNTKIKKLIVKYAIGSLVVIPLICFSLLILGTVHLPRVNSPMAEISLTAYAQAALIITPILFFAAVIRQLIASFAGEKSSDKSDDGMTDMIKVIRETLKQSGQS